MAIFKSASFGLLIAWSAWFLSACSDCQPIPAAGNRISVQFYRIDSLLSGGKRIAFDKSLTKLEAVGASDTFPSQSRTGALNIWLPNHKDTAGFKFTTAKGQESLLFSFHRKLTPQPPNCGAYIEFSQLSIVSSNFDSVFILPTSLDVQGFQVEIFDLP